MAKKDYTSDDILVLSDIDHVRTRTQIYLGNMNKTEYTVPNFIDGTFSIKQFSFVPAVFKSVGEILDNSIDELSQLNKRIKTIQILADPEYGVYTIRDNGRGIPIDKHETGKFTPEVALGSLRAGRNFGDTEAGVIGQNGVGSACVNYCSSIFDVKINRDKRVYTQSFKNGAKDVSEAVITDGPARTGTQVSFTLDPTVFENGTDLPSDMMHNRAIEIAFNNPGTTVQYCEHIYKFNNGLEDLIKKFSKDYFKFNMGDMEFYVIFDKYEGLDEQMFTWVNSSLLIDGGLCNTQFMNAFSDKVINSVTSIAKKQKCKVTKNDVRQNLLVFGCLKVAKPEYDAQSKTRLTGPCMRKDINQLLDTEWKGFAKNNKEWFDTIVARAAERHHSNANKNAIKEMSKPSRAKVVGLTDATSRKREQCMLLITEGLSAASMITEVRDPVTVGSFPLTGKINNVYNSTVSELMKMVKVINLLKAIGLVPGKKAHVPALRFGKAVITTDADPDGDDIMTLLVNMFYKFWPELLNPNMKEPFLYRLVAPNVVASKNGKRIHFANRDEYEKKKGKYKTWTIEYCKGLGSMIVEDWEMILSGESETLIPIVDDGNMKETLDLLFNDKLSDQRKEWLQ